MPGTMTIPTDAIRAFCTRWMIVEFAIFGSAIRDDFRPDSDVDVLVTFAPGTTRDFDDYDQMEDELAALFGRRVDLVERRRVVNPFRLAHILANHRVVYAA